MFRESACAMFHTSRDLCYCEIQISPYIIRDTKSLSKTRYLAGGRRRRLVCDTVDLRKYPGPAGFALIYRFYFELDLSELEGQLGVGLFFF